jgi:nicotinamide-nucleotide amidase
MTTTHNADIVTIGDEILIGQIVDSNSAFLARKLNEIGLRIRKKYSVGDSREAIRAVLDEGIGAVSLIVFTGGLGPTRDDITKETLREYFGGALSRNQAVYEMMRVYFERAGREFSVANRAQADVPETCRVFLNHNGTAPGMLFEKNGTKVISMPGVPYEMEAMMESEVIPYLTKEFNLPPVIHKTILTQGIPESILMEMIRPWEDSLDPRVKLAYLPSPGMVRLRLTSAVHFEGVDEYIQRKTDELTPMLPGRIFGYGTDTMESVLMRMLEKRHAKVAFAESCTGGYLAHRLTFLSGSSRVYDGSVVTYGYDAKSELLGVSSDLLNREGAVSEPVVVQMAEGVKKMFGTAYSISTSGIAGPDGGTAEKPVGTVWIAVSGPSGTVAKKFRFMGNRMRNIQMTMLTGFNMLRLMMEDE